MTDIVESLRHPGTYVSREDAITEIERMRAALREARDFLQQEVDTDSAWALSIAIDAALAHGEQKA